MCCHMDRPIYLFIYFGKSQSGLTEFGLAFNDLFIFVPLNFFKKWVYYVFSMVIDPPQFLKIWQFYFPMVKSHNWDFYEDFIDNNNTKKEDKISLHVIESDGVSEDMIPPFTATKTCNNVLFKKKIIIITC